MKVLITGIYGFLGSHLFERLKHKVVIAGLARTHGLLGEVKVYASDKLDTIDFDPDFIVYCHAEVSSGSNQVEISRLFNANVFLTEQICRRFPDAKPVYVSSVSIYCQRIKTIVENSSVDPHTDYAISKLWGERIFERYEQASILRLSSLYGCGMRRNTIIPNYTRQALEKGLIEVWGDGSRRQNYIHVFDAVSYIEAILKNYDCVQKSLFLGVGSAEISNFGLAKIIAEKVGCKIELVYSDSSVSFSYNNTFTREKLGYETTVSLKEGIHKYVECEQKQS